jgi:hypothetical protein
MTDSLIALVAWAVGTNRSPRSLADQPTYSLGVAYLLRAAFLNAVISSFSFKSRGLVRVSLVPLTRSEFSHFGFASAAFECDDASVAIFSELHAAVFHRLDACPHC